MLYLAPTRALAADQLRALGELGIPGVRAAVLDGDTPAAQRDWARSHANYLLTTPDMLHQTLLPRHARWTGFYRRLRYIVVDECHTYRGVFGSHVAQVLRRLHRVAVHHIETAAAPASTGPGSTASAGTEPVFLLASATVSDPAGCARLLTGRPAEAVTENAAPRGPVTFALWEPPLTRAHGEADAPVRRSATAEAATLLADLVAEAGPGAGLHPVPARRRRGRAGRAAGAPRGGRGGRRANGSPPTGPVTCSEDRRALEEALRTGAITGLATTTALELGVDITGLDAVLIAGWPGTRAALWQQAGRAGRAGRPSVVVLIARDDPLDTLPGAPPRGAAAPPGRGDRAGPGQPLRAGPASVRGGRGAAAHPGRPGHVRPRRRRDRGRADPPWDAAPPRRRAVLDQPGPAAADRAARHRDAPGQDR